MNEDTPGRPIEVIVYDETLDFADLQPFSRKYTFTGNDFRIVNKWAGPAAGGVEWALIEIAVFVVLAHDVLNTFVDTREFIRTIYRKVKTDTGARNYIAGSVGIAMDNNASTVRVVFSLPKGLSDAEVKEQIDRVVRDAPRILADWEGAEWVHARMRAGKLTEARLLWDAKADEWRPTPAEREAILREFNQLENGTPP